MDWKEENPKKRYIDEINSEEARKIAWLAEGCPDEFELLYIVSECNGNNIPHVKIHFKYGEIISGEVVEEYVGIFENLNTYLGETFRSVYCQKEIFEAYAEMGFN